MQAGNSITPREAYLRFECLALHSRIAELRERGIEIDCEIVVDGKKRWGRYSVRRAA